MLQLLPNELLVKILRKTKPKTNRTCRFLNRRFDSIVVKFNLHQENARKMSIEGLYCLEKPITSWEIQIEWRNYKIQKRKFNNFELFLKELKCCTKNIRELNYLVLTEVEMSEDFLDLLVGTRCFSGIGMLQIYECNFEKVSSNKWMVYLDSLQLHNFATNNTEQGNTTPVSKKMFENVTCSFQYYANSFDDTVDMSWLDDKMLESWYSSWKTLRIWKCKTGLTIDGIIKYLERGSKFSTVKQAQEFGTIQNTTPHQIQAALNKANAVWRELGTICRIMKIRGNPVDGYFILQATEE